MIQIVSSYGEKCSPVKEARGTAGGREGVEVQEQEHFALMSHSLRKCVLWMDLQIGGFLSLKSCPLCVLMTCCL